MAAGRNWLIYLILIFSTIGCEYLPFNRGPLDGPYRYRFVEQFSKPGRVIFEDLEGNNQYTYFRYHPEFEENSFTIFTYDRDNNYIDQNNFDGELRALEFMDWNQDGKKEIFLIYEILDSCYAEIINEKGNTLIERIFLFSGKPRYERTKRHEWFGLVNWCQVVDLENDGTKELAIFVSETSGGKPRGILVYDLITFDSVWKHEIGPTLVSSEIVDTDNNGTIEILLATSAPNNDNTVNNTTDSLSYVILVDHNGNEIWKKEYGEVFSTSFAVASDIDNDKSIDFLVSKARGGTEKNPDIRLEYVDGLNGKPLISQKFPLYTDINFTLLQIDQNLDKEILLVDRYGETHILDHHFNTIIQREFPSEITRLEKLGDLTGDGLDEFTLEIQGRWFLINHKLQILTEIFGNLRIIPNYPNYTPYVKLLPRRNLNPLLAIYNEEDQITYFMALEINPNLIFQLTAPWVIIIISIGLFGFILLWIVRTKNRLSILSRSFSSGFELNENPIIFINRKMQIAQANAAAIQLLKIENNTLPFSITSLSDRHGNLKEYLFSLKTKNPIRYKNTILISEEDESKISIIAQPIGERGRKKVNWLVVFHNKTFHDTNEATTWAKMAQRLAHDIKNPLTSILLTQQRLQKEYSKEPQNKVKNYDKYSNRIIERIETLRKLSRNFMKYVNVEKINAQPTNINQFLDEIFSDTIIDLPKDVKLEKNLNTDIPVVQIDQELIHSVIENLVSNAINAMPTGGTLTVSTGRNNKLQPGGPEQPPNDYIRIELMDTGVGIQDDMKELLFKPFTTNTKHGTGLGLTIVKKIIDDHKGYIEVFSEDGDGSTFTIYIPINAKYN